MKCLGWGTCAAAPTHRSPQLSGEPGGAVTPPEEPVVLLSVHGSVRTDLSPLYGPFFSL